MSALERWKEAGLVEVGLPSGFQIKVLPVTPATLVLLNLAPSIVDAVLDANAAGETEEQAGAGLGGTAMDVAFRGIRCVWDTETETWEPVSLTAADAATGAFNPDDVEAIMDAVLGRLNVEGQAGYDDLRTFRRDATGDAPGQDGGAVRAAPVVPRRARRSAARAGAGRGAGAPAGAG